MRPTTVEGILRADSTSRSLGNMQVEEGARSATFVLTNTSDTTLHITDVRTSCSCTQAAYSQRPLQPADTAHVTLTYNPKNRLGEVDGVAHIYTSATGRRAAAILELTGTVTSNDPFFHLPHALGRNMKVSRRSLTIADVQPGQQRRESIACANIGKSPITLTAPMVPDFVSIQTSPAPLPPNTEGDIIFVIDGSRTPNGETKIPVLLKGLDGKPSDSIIMVTINPTPNPSPKGRGATD